MQRLDPVVGADAVAGGLGAEAGAVVRLVGQVTPMAIGGRHQRIVFGFGNDEVGVHRVGKRRGAQFRLAWAWGFFPARNSVRFSRAQVAWRTTLS